MFDLSSKKVIDLTMSISMEMPGVDITTAKDLLIDGWNATNLHLYSHSGTHMDAPVHFGVNSVTIDQIESERFISEAWIVDLTHLENKALIGVEDMKPIKDKIKKGQSLLLKTGWSKKVNTPAYRDELPRISTELAEWLGEKQVNILGVEPPSVADVNTLDEVTSIHTILMSHDIVIVEGLTNLDMITKEKVLLIAFPIKVKNGDGAPARVLAIE
ncbi:cyclase family protein [Winogradskyella sp. R77965]|uniref:cyclase family protein n=1 Tax=Winogradskyella sp. R77965 TaxID=3093872 RepID=UPI0037DC1F3B